ncbi:MAG: hypothetical protein MK132_18715 [Lentisphaerales bacterium]|nr:hypothetical protein [Lentisphaerales bacterium]
MEALIFMGLQASGKSSFYKENFFNSHIRLSMDLLNTRNREKRFLELSIQTQAKIVVDNTNPSLSDRQRYIPLLKEAGYQIHGYYFASFLERCLKRNEQRSGKECIPKGGVLATYNNLTLPKYKEGFDKLFYVSIKDEKFSIAEWEDEV